MKIFFLEIKNCTKIKIRPLLILVNMILYPFAKFFYNNDRFIEISKRRRLQLNLHTLSDFSAAFCSIKSIQN